MTGRDRLATVFTADMLAALEDLIDERAEQKAIRILAASVKLRERSPYMTPTEASEFLRAKPQRVHDLLSAGKLTRHKDGARTLIARAELEAYVANGRGGA